MTALMQKHTCSDPIMQVTSTVNRLSELRLVEAPAMRCSFTRAIPVAMGWKLLGPARRGPQKEPPAEDLRDDRRGKAFAATAFPV